jgi:hypothetical protein
MKKISADEAANLPTRPSGYASAVRIALLSLKPGEYLVIEKKDWSWKSQTPCNYCRRLEKETNNRFHCEHILDGSGWLVKKIS